MEVPIYLVEFLRKRAQVPNLFRGLHLSVIGLRAYPVYSEQISFAHLRHRCPLTERGTSPTVGRL